MYKLLFALLALILSLSSNAQDSFAVIDFPTTNVLKKNSEFSNLNYFIKLNDQFSKDSIVMAYSYLNDELKGEMATHMIFTFSKYWEGMAFYRDRILTPTKKGNFKLVVSCNVYSKGVVDKTLTDTVEMIVENEWDRDLAVNIDPFSSDSIIQGNARVIFYLRNMGTKNYSGSFPFTLNVWTTAEPNSYSTAFGNYTGGTILPGDSAPVSIEVPEWILEDMVGFKTKTCFSIRPTNGEETIDDHLANNVTCMTMYNLGIGNNKKSGQKIGLKYSNQNLQFTDEIDMTSQLSIYNMNGKLMAKKRVEQQQTNAILDRPLTKGMYQVILSNKNGYSSTKLLVR